jgi:hypothetical protein
MIFSIRQHLRKIHPPIGGAMYARKKEPVHLTKMHDFQLFVSILGKFIPLSEEQCTPGKKSRSTPWVKTGQDPYAFSV